MASVPTSRSCFHIPVWNPSFQGIVWGASESSLVLPVCRRRDREWSSRIRSRARTAPFLTSIILNSVTFRNCFAPQHPGKGSRHCAHRHGLRWQVSAWSSHVSLSVPHAQNPSPLIVQHSLVRPCGLHTSTTNVGRVRNVRIGVTRCDD